MAVPLQVDLPRDHYTVEDWLRLPEAGQTLELTEPFPVTFDPACLLGRRAR
jgi:hypothetical protein